MSASATPPVVGPGAGSLGTAPALRDYLRILYRQKWTVLLAVVVSTGAATFFALQQEPRYAAAAQVLLSRVDLSATLNGIDDPGLALQPDRVASTHANLARVPAVAGHVLRAAKVRDMTPEQFLDSSTVSVKPNADLLEFTVKDKTPERAALLSTEYARQFTIFLDEIDAAAVERARLKVQERIAQLEASGTAKGPVYEALFENEERLSSIQALQTSKAFVVQRADRGEQIQPRPKRAALLGLGLGIVLGIGLAFLWEAFDTRIRSTSEIVDGLGLTLLARLPRGRRAPTELVMLQDPDHSEAEPFRVLRTNIDFANLQHGARSILVVSALPGEGKSHTAANLAVSFARSGRHVVLVDMDLRFSSVGEIFRLGNHPGLTDVALGEASLEHALVQIGLGRTLANSSIAGGDNGKFAPSGTLEVLAAGQPPPNPAEFLTTQPVTEILAKLEARADLVLIDTPAMLSVSDAIALSPKAQALLVVVGLHAIRRPALNELRRILNASPISKLGFAVTGADDDDAFRYRSRYPRYVKQRTKERHDPLTNGASTGSAQAEVSSERH